MSFSIKHEHSQMKLSGEFHKSRVKLTLEYLTQKEANVITLSKEEARKLSDYLLKFVKQAQ